MDSEGKKSDGKGADDEVYGTRETQTTKYPQVFPDRNFKMGFQTYRKKLAPS
jgi:hypothetical protein